MDYFQAIIKPAEIFDDQIKCMNLREHFLTLGDGDIEYGLKDDWSRT